MKDNKIQQAASNTYGDVLNHIQKYLNVKDDVLDSEFGQLAGDASRVVSFIRKTNELIINKKFENFLKGFSMDEQPTEKQVRKLINYIDDESKAEFISDTLSKLLLSNSTKACTVLGSVVNSIDKEGTLSYEKLICVNALTSLYDFDIDNLLIINRFLESKPRYKRHFGLGVLHSYCKKNNLNKDNLYLTVDKAVNNQLFNRSFETNIDVGNVDVENEQVDIDNGDIDEYYIINSIGIKLIGYLKRVV
ncbi:hypothetical protein KFZ58_15655 [Virgibacillus sp. NKC19-16]|uniref:hypothetical protein n=1 Tax=Virgibacillus salidurans TaxID=2831673 RepID=UPI001F293396|nr:hypothetical protein [Virgibacillus sp. NKC19-16]UJL45803.1 hypothetical protein KFZ58_15655 [Virgibacillus sp. NKC19-16]